MARKTKRADQPSKDENAAIIELPSPPQIHAGPTSIWAILRNSKAQKASQLIVLAALYSSISQLTLAPVYGSVPAGLYHRYGATGAALLGFLLKGQGSPAVRTRAGGVLPTFAFWIPTIQFVLFRYSSIFGNPLGPLITELLTYYPLVVLSVYVSGICIDQIDLTAFDSLVSDVAVPLGSFMLFLTTQRGVQGFFQSIASSHLLRSRVGFQLIIASLYGLLLPSSLFWPAIPSAAFTVLGNVHTPLTRTSEVLNNTLALYDFTLVERRESITGYISVLQHTKAHFRVMRCDHSLLGGEWTIPPPKGQVPRVKEPIYGVFAMLEAVRLVEVEKNDSRSDTEKTALNIGLGVGTAPAAMIAHGIKTTIIEIDPVVYDFARRHFALPLNHTFVIGDALSIVNGWSQVIPPPLYDYIIHDVFTGGAEPAELFTIEFLSDVAMLLRPNGAIAINYAGDLAQPAASLIFRTVRAVFPSCRVFRENESHPMMNKINDLTNMVIFCTKSSAPVTFRKVRGTDYLGSGAREQFLFPRHEIFDHSFSLDGDVLKKGLTKQLEKWQAQSAISHWKVMRTVLPDAVWESW